MMSIDNQVEYQSLTNRFKEKPCRSTFTYLSLTAILLWLLLPTFAYSATIEISPVDDSCKPVSSAFSSCAQACEADALGCAGDIHTHVNTEAFKARRLPYLNTKKNDPNPTTPMHGLFNTMYINQAAQKGIEDGLAKPFEPMDLADWSIVVKYNENPGLLPENATWETHMYKIPGYCPKKITAAPDSPCLGGEWFWFLHREGGFLAFDYDEVYGSEQAWGKAETFCLDCHGAVANSDWLWKTHFERDLERQDMQPTTVDGQTPGPGGAKFCEDINQLNSELPPDVYKNPAEVKPPETPQRMFDCFSWKTFVALNWPAKKDKRGEADTEVPYNVKNRDRVWETYKQVYETFQPHNPDWTLADKQWNDAQPLPNVCWAALKKSDIELHDSRALQVLNESHQAFGNQFNNLVDTNGNELRYNVRFNETEWLFMKQNGYADTGSYDYNGPLNKFITFPDNRNGHNGLGVMELKSSWKELCTDPQSCNKVDDPDRYYTRHVFIYDPAIEKSKGTKPDSCRVARMGLVGLHIMAKTFWSPQWVWATFEHLDNVPNVGEQVDANVDSTPYTLFDPMCLIDPPTEEECLGTRPGVLPPLVEKDPKLYCCNNLQNIPNSSPDPNNPFNPVLDLKNNLEPPNKPVQVTRLDAIGENAKALNKIFQPLLKEANSPFQYYQLINTQWPGKGRLGADQEPQFAIVNKLCDGTEDETQHCFNFLPAGIRLRNTTMETFQASYCKPEGNSIDSTPADCTSEMIEANPKQSSSAGCMNCHVPTGNDTSFIWADAIEEQVPLNLN